MGSGAGAEPELLTGIGDATLDAHSQRMMKQMEARAAGVEFDDATQGIDLQNDADEIMYRREAVRMARMEEKSTSKDYKIEARKSGETMRQFKTRVRQETKDTLRKELQGMTASSKKRKENFDALKEKKKQKKENKGKKKETNLNEFFRSEKGDLRASDLGGVDSFADYRPTEESVSFSSTLSKTASLGAGVTGGGNRVGTGGSASGPVRITSTSSTSAFSLQDVEAAAAARKARGSEKTEDTTKPPDLRGFKDSLEQQKQKMMAKGQQAQRVAAELAAQKQKAIAAYKALRQKRHEAKQNE